MSVSRRLAHVRYQGPERSQPGHDAIVATALPFQQVETGELEVDLRQYGKHVA